VPVAKLDDDSDPESGIVEAELSVSEGKAAISGIRGGTSRRRDNAAAKSSRSVSAIDASDFISDEESGAAISGIRGETQR